MAKSGAFLVAAVFTLACGSPDAPRSRELSKAEADTVRGCPLPGHPTPDCTGVPPGTVLTELPLNDSGNTYRVTTAGTVIDGKHIAGNLLITASDVIIQNSQIDGTVINEYGPNHYAFTITDSTVGPATGCITAPGVGEAAYTAVRVHVRGHDDGFRMSGNDVTIRDSFVRQCANATSHADGLQAYCPDAPCTGLVFEHNTVDARGIDATFMVNLVDPNLGAVSVRDNLLMGGAFTLVTQWHSGAAWEIHDNRIVDGAWAYGPASAEGTCAHQNWSGNSIVTIDADYDIVSTVSPLPCVD